MCRMRTSQLPVFTLSCFIVTPLKIQAWEWTDSSVNVSTALGHNGTSGLQEGKKALAVSHYLFSADIKGRTLDSAACIQYAGRHVVFCFTSYDTQRILATHYSWSCVTYCYSVSVETHPPMSKGFVFVNPRSRCITWHIVKTRFCVSLSGRIHGE